MQMLATEYDDGFNKAEHPWERRILPSLRERVCARMSVCEYDTSTLGNRTLALLVTMHERISIDTFDSMLNLHQIHPFWGYGCSMSMPLKASISNSNLLLLANLQFP